MKMSKATEEMDKLIAEIEDEDAPDNVQYCWVILDDLKRIRKLMKE